MLEVCLIVYQDSHQSFEKIKYLAAKSTMAKSGPLIIIDDDKDDLELIEEVLKDLEVPNERLYFQLGAEAFKYLKETPAQPCVILCDVNLPRETGVDLKRQIDSDPHLRKKAIPFVFYSTSVNQADINDAYLNMTVQGFFKKGNNYKEIKQILSLIIEYWKLCKHPNSE